MDSTKANDRAPYGKPLTIYQSTIDYRSLLKKYIAHIIDCEGSDYITFYGMPGKIEAVFTDEEIAELRKLSEEGL